MKPYMLTFFLVAFGGSAVLANEPVATASGQSFLIYVAKGGKTGDPKCHDYYGDCLLFTSDKPLMSITDIKFAKLSGGEKPGVIIYLSDKERTSLKELSRAYLGQQLAIVYKGIVVHSPRVRTIIDSSELKMTFCNRRNYDVVLRSLAGEMKDDFNKEYDCKCDTP